MTRILLIEDDSGIVKSLSLYLTQSDIQVDVAHDGEEAMNIFTNS